ncbi:hypothetical protein DFH07DRAFT_815952 [Mycena maculata]|uniref:Uncharacterized protein n=1 Tax=Mycena maculata TaxID=230809 RepID=A0AAD7JC76_9AGAR|nr:hypothetical protein DFH07DRAFT_815952 [Mycena maculata]
MAPIDLNNLPPLEQIKGGSLSNLHKGELLSVAKALGISMPAKPGDVMKPELLLSVKASLGASSDVRFLKFKVHRPDTTGGAALKNSADKAKEDSEASAKKEAPSGASQKLLALDAKTDPPAQHQRLGSNPKASEVHNSKANEEELVNSDASSPLSDDRDFIGTASSPEREDPVVPSDTVDGLNPTNDTMGAIPSNQALLKMDECPIVIAFQGYDRREIWILPAQRGNISVHKTPEGVYISSWKALIPRALVQFSPAKGSGSVKISVNGPTGNPLPLGTIDDFMKGNLPPVLSLKEADTCTLIQKGSLLICEVSLGTGKSLPADTVKGDDTAFMGDVKPLEVAKARRRVPVKAGKKPRNFADSDEDDHKDDPEFLDFLGAMLATKKIGYGRSLKTAGEMRERWIDLETATAKCDADFASSIRGTAAYRVPASYADHINPEYHRFTNRGFNKREIELALKIGHTIAGEDRKLFKSPLLKDDPEAQRWVDGDEDLDEKVIREFDRMSRKQFLERLDKSHEDAQNARAKAAKVEEKKRKRDERKQVSDSSEDSSTDSEQERRDRRKRRKEKKKRAEAEGSSSKALKKSKDSDDLDS